LKIKDQIQILRVLKGKPQFDYARVGQASQDGFLRQNLLDLVLPMNVAFFHDFDGEIFSWWVLSLLLLLLLLLLLPWLLLMLWLIFTTTAPAPAPATAPAAGSESRF